MDRVASNPPPDINIDYQVSTREDFEAEKTVEQVQYPFLQAVSSIVIPLVSIHAYIFVPFYLCSAAAHLFVVPLGCSPLSIVA